MNRRKIVPVTTRRLVASTFGFELNNYDYNFIILLYDFILLLYMYFTYPLYSCG